MARDKLEAANLLMAEQEKTSRRVSTILKPGGNLTGKDAIIRDLKDNLKRQKTYNGKLEKKLDGKQETLRELEDKLKDMMIERDSVKDELQRSFSRMDVDVNSGGVNIELLITDPSESFVNVDYTAHEEEVHKQFNEVVQENEELKSEVEEVRLKLREFSSELERERLYVEKVESNFERELLKNTELQDKLIALQKSKFDSSLPVIQESFEESLYDGNLTKEQIVELLDKLDALQEELNKEKIWIEHLEEQNDQLRIDLSKVQSVDKFTGDEKDELFRKYSETETMLDKRLEDLAEAQRVIDELRQKLISYQENELRYMDDVDNVSEQLEHSLIELSDHELMNNALTVEKTDLEVQIRDLRDENGSLLDKTVAQQEEIVSLAEEKEELLKKINEFEEAGKFSEVWKNSAEEASKKLDDLESEFESVNKMLTEKTHELDSSKTLFKAKESEYSEMLMKVETIKTEATELIEKLKEAELNEHQYKALVDDLEAKVETLAADRDSFDHVLEEKDQELNNCKILFEEKLIECSEIIKKVDTFEIKTSELNEKLKDVTVLEEHSKAFLEELEAKVKTLEAEKDYLNQTLIVKKDELARVMKKMEESDIDTKDLKNKLKELSNLEVLVKEKDNIIIASQNEVEELKGLLEEEKLMNNNNRKAMDEMQAEVRADRKAVLSMKVESEARVRLVQEQCAEKVKTEQLMNDKNRSVMTDMQKEVRRERADRAILQTALIDANKSIKCLQEKEETNEKELNKLWSDIKELNANNEIFNLHSAMNSVQESMQEMEIRDAELMQTLDGKLQHNSTVQSDLEVFKAKLAQSTEQNYITLSVKDATIAALEAALSEEVVKYDSLEQVVKSFQDKTFASKESQFSPNKIDSGYQTDFEFPEVGCQFDVPMSEAESQTTLTSELVDKLEAKAVVLEETMQQNVSVQSELKALSLKLSESSKLHCDTLSEKETAISTLEMALSEEAVKAASLKQELKTFQDKIFASKECQVAPNKVNGGYQTILNWDEIGCQIGLSLMEAESKSNETMEIAGKLEDKVKVLEKRLSIVINEADSIETELIDAQRTVASLEKDLGMHKELLQDITRQLNLMTDDNQQLQQETVSANKSINAIKQINEQLVTANKILQTELDILLEARNETDNVIEDKEKDYLEIAEKYHLEKVERDAANETIIVLTKDMTKLEGSLTVTKKQLEDEKDCNKCLQDEANQSINSLNKDLRRRLLEQSYAHILSSDSEDDDDYTTLPRRARKSTDFRDALEETKSSINALARANSKLGHQIEKLISEKDSFINKSNDESNVLVDLKKKIHLIASQNEKLDSETKSLQIELMEKEVTIEILEENVTSIKRELENTQVMALKKSPQDRATLTELNDLKHRCFMVMPSDPAREILHMFVSQYKDNLCSNCYARITTLGSRPASPRKASPGSSPRQKRQSGGTTTSDTVVQTDSAMFSYGTDSAYSSSVSMQTDQLGSSNVERLKMRTNHLSNDLSDSRKSEKELELALQYQLKVAGDLQKKVGKLEVREKALLDQMAELAEAEQKTVKKEEKYGKLLERYRGNCSSPLVRDAIFCLLVL